MKNVHVLPKEEKLDFKKNTLHNEEYKPLYIYITSDEQAKEGDWGYIPFEGGNVKLVGKYFADDWKKIILTTDQDLINDGVQKIDDKFLRWFVMNPSCEEVEVESMVNMIQFTPREFIYKIIIPKEEPKPIHEQIIDAVGGEEKFKEIAGLKPKQETLEEASWKYNPLKKLDGEFLRHAFKEGARWQSENMYNKEKVDKLLDTLIQNNMCSVAGDELIEQFKNK